MKPVHTDRVTYRWTGKDAVTVQDALKHPEKAHPADPKQRPVYVTPYNIVPGVLPGDAALKPGDAVTVPLDKSNERWSVDRFFVDGCVWEKIPPEVTGYTTIGELCAALAKALPARFDHLKPDGKSAEQRNATALLLFDYWQNSDYRFAVVKEGFSWETLKSGAAGVPTDKGGQKLTWVLAKAPIKPPPIKVPPDRGDKGDKPPAATIVIPDPLFSATIKLRPDAEDRRLSPLLVATDKWRQSKLQFDVEIKQEKTRAAADETTLRVRRADGTVLFEEVHTGDDFVKPGKLIWAWDGYSSTGVLDTAVLRGGIDVEVVVAAKPGKDGVGKTSLHDGRNGVDWLDLRIVESSRRVFADVFLVPKQRSSDPISDFDYRSAMMDVQQGIEKHWSRSITVGGQSYAVQTSAQFKPNRGIGFTIIGTTDPSERSCNLRVISDLLDVWYYYNTAPAADEDERVRRVNDNRETAAHEFGHSVIGTQPRGAAANGPYSSHFSLTHKGTSYEWQKTKPTAPTYPAAPAECDVMFYYKDYEPDDAFDRVFGSEDDAKHLVTLGQVDFED